MDERNDSDKIDEFMLPGFRFHPTDEELVGFYLRKKVQQRPLSIELIKQLDIYKYDPWDLPRLATTGEKEWYFYCPRDRKYRNSTRPNRVTGAGFWKATGTDRPIYSSEGSKCIGLKKSLVFYKGRAAKGIKTDWMMHEFRLPSLPDSVSSKRFLSKNIPANEAWAICRIFKKANSHAQRALSHSWVSPLVHEPTISDHMINQHADNLATQFNFSNMVSTSKPNISHQFNYSNEIQQSSISSFSPVSISVPYKSINHMECSKLSQVSMSNEAGDLATSYTFSSSENSEPSTLDASSMLLNMSSSIFGDLSSVSENMSFSTLQEQYNSFLTVLNQDIEGNAEHEEGTAMVKDQNVGVHFSSPLGMADAWKANLLWDPNSPCPSELSTSFSTNKHYT